MDNSLKRATALMAVVLMLTGCSSQDNKSNNHSTDDARLEPVEQAYDGCDKLLGSDHGSFKLPEKISKVDFNKVYNKSEFQHHETRFFMFNMVQRLLLCPLSRTFVHQ